MKKEDLPQWFQDKYKIELEDYPEDNGRYWVTVSDVMKVLDEIGD